MSFETFNDFLTMGGHGLYVWLSYAIALIVVVANLKPAKLRGIESQGMILAATDDSGIALLHPGRLVRNNSPVK